MPSKFLMSRYTIIVAATKANGIGANGRLPWRLSKEMKYFAQVTSAAPEGKQNVVVMGRNTWESIPKKFRPLPRRFNVVISRNREYDLGTTDGSTILKDNLKAGLSVLDANPTTLHRGFILGGATLYSESLAFPLSSTDPCVDRVLLTRILSPDFNECDVFMPDFLKEDTTGPTEWKRSSHAALQEWVGFEVPEGEQEDNGIKYEFQMWVRGRVFVTPSTQHGGGDDGGATELQKAKQPNADALPAADWKPGTHAFCLLFGLNSTGNFMHNTRHHNPQALAAPQVGGRLAVGIFVFTLLAFVIESEFTQYVQTTLGYRQPFFLFYLVHSSFAIIFPLHLLYLLATTNYTTVSLLRGLSLAISNHLAPGQKSPNYHFPRAKFIRLILGCTLGITCPALLWFAAVSLASVSDVTAIWNTNAFFAYLISVKLFKLQWEARRLFAVVLATLGTIAVVYGGSTAPVEKDPSTGGPPTTTSVGFRPSAPLLGNLLTLVASFGYGLYQVLYKIYAALPSDPEVAADIAYEQIPEDDEPAISVDPDEAVYPPPFGFHPNLLTSLMGLCTALVLWIPIPFLHWSGTEPFRLPPNMLTVLSICGIALSGVVFNAGFMVLLGVWGPIIVSVGNLLTIVLVLISDVLFGAGIEVVTFWSLLGSGVIVMAFGVLAYDMFTKKT